tara:strand:- start:3786 stop:4430 length:645 start_codon:yes stop_codon:yes gene_type:complete
MYLGIQMFKIINFILFLSTVFGQQIDYQTQIQPIFNESCTNCHGYSGGLALGNYDQLMSGGNSGDLVIPGDYQNSILWQRIDSGEMPPAGDISNNQLELIENWIMQGALEEVLKIDEMEISPDHFTLYQNYPNPFNPSTIISYNLPKDSHVNISIFDVLGRKVKTLTNHYMKAGKNKVQWNGENDHGKLLAAGVYIYKIQSGGYNQSKKMILVK